MMPFVDLKYLRHVPCGQCFRPAQPHDFVTRRLPRSPRCLAYKQSTTFCQRRLQLKARSLHRSGVPIVATVREAPTPNMNKKGSAWIPSGVLLAVGGALPGLLLASNWQQISDLGPAYQGMTLAAVDTIFILTATCFLSLGSWFGTQRYGDTPKYPGPFVELDGTRTPPSFFSVYVVVIPLLLGIIAPTAGLGMLVWQNDAYLGACTLGLYLVEVAAQLVSEDVYLKTNTAMWPQVPQVYQTYRIWQLIRGCYLVGQLGGPSWLWSLQAMLILLWVFNFGAVMTWTPWLYRWHLQPRTLQNGRKDD